MSKIEYNRVAYEVAVECGQVDLNEAIRERLIQCVKGTPLGPVTMDVADIDKREFHVLNQGGGIYYFIHKNLMPLGLEPTKQNLNIITKIAVAELRDHPVNIETPSYVHYIYTRCKYLKYRGKPETTVDRFDTFITGKDKRQSGDYKGQAYIRHQGSRHGNTAKSKSPEVRAKNKESRQANKEENMLFVRTLMYGPEFSNRELYDTFFRNSLEGHSLYNAISDNLHTTAIYTLHHALFKDRTSVHKVGSKEPSTILAQQSFRTLDANSVNEFLGCIAMGEDGHKLIHNTHQHDDIHGWFNRFNNGDCAWLPNHWLSRVQYDATVFWLQENIENYTEDDVLDYDDFIKTMSFTEQQIFEIKETLLPEQRKTTKFEQMFNYKNSK